MVTRDRRFPVSDRDPRDYIEEQIPLSRILSATVAESLMFVRHAHNKVFMARLEQFKISRNPKISKPALDLWRALIESGFGR